MRGAAAIDVTLMSQNSISNLHMKLDKRKINHDKKFEK